MTRWTKAQWVVEGDLGCTGEQVEERGRGGVEPPTNLSLVPSRPVSMPRICGRRSQSAIIFRDSRLSWNLLMRKMYAVITDLHTP